MKIPDLNKPTDGRQVFKTPDGYFENLSQRMMQGVSEAVDPVERKNTVPFWKSEIYAKLKPYIYMAAMFGGLYFGVWVYKYQQRLTGEKEKAERLVNDAPAERHNASDEWIDAYVDEACDFMMPNSHDIIACLTESE